MVYNHATFICYIFQMVYYLANILDPNPIHSFPITTLHFSTRALQKRTYPVKKQNYLYSQRPKTCLYFQWTPFPPRATNPKQPFAASLENPAKPKINFLREKAIFKLVVAHPPPPLPPSLCRDARIVWKHRSRGERATLFHRFVGMRGIRGPKRQGGRERRFVVRIVRPDTIRNATRRASAREGIIRNFRNVLHGSVPADDRPNLPVSSASVPRCLPPSAFVLASLESLPLARRIFSIPAPVIRTMKIVIERVGHAAPRGRVIGLMPTFYGHCGSAELKNYGVRFIVAPGVRGVSTRRFRGCFRRMESSEVL